jgi:hypothetical protein
LLVVLLPPNYRDPHFVAHLGKPQGAGKVPLGPVAFLHRFADGRVLDFHARRMSFVSNLALGGVPLAVAQKLARHSDPRLTANVYTHLGLADLGKAVEALPPLPSVTLSTDTEMPTTGETAVPPTPSGESAGKSGRAPRGTLRRLNLLVFRLSRAGLSAASIGSS